MKNTKQSALKEDVEKPESKQEKNAQPLHLRHLFTSVYSRVIFFWGCLIAGNLLYTIPAFAAPDVDAISGAAPSVRGGNSSTIDINPSNTTTGIPDVDAGLSAVIQLVAGIVRGAGFVILAWGVFDFAAGYQQHDSAQQTSGLRKVVAGILMVFALSVVEVLMKGNTGATQSETEGMLRLFF